MAPGLVRLLRDQTPPLKDWLTVGGLGMHSEQTTVR